METGADGYQHDNFRYVGLEPKACANVCTHIAAVVRMHRISLARVHPALKERHEPH